MDFNKFDTFIFDFDGTLLNSEPYHKLAHSKVLSLILNKEIKFTDKDFERYIGKRDTEIFEMYKADFNVDFNKEEMINKKVQIATDLLSNEKVKIFSYFFDLTKLKGKKMYIVSNQHENVLFPVLKNKNIMKYFDDIFCLPKMDIKKENFYKNIKKYIPNYNNIIVFEDDVKVLKYLKEIGYQIVAIKNEMNSDIMGDNFENTIKTI